MRLDPGENMQVDVERNCKHERSERPRGGAHKIEIWARFVGNTNDVIILELL
jgi:hypothetical protein